MNGGAADETEIKAAVRKTKQTPIPGEIARRTYQIIWWLSRIRMRPGEPVGGFFMTNEEEAVFWFSPGYARSTVVIRPGGTWGKYDRESWAKFADIVLDQLKKKPGIEVKNPTSLVGKPPK